MINSILFDCASTYLHSAPVTRKIEPQKKERKVEAVSAVYHGKKFNPSAGEKANFSTHIDICI